MKKVITDTQLGESKIPREDQERISKQIAEDDSLKELSSTVSSSITDQAESNIEHTVEGAISAIPIVGEIATPLLESVEGLEGTLTTGISTIANITDINEEIDQAVAEKKRHTPLHPLYTEAERKKI